MSTHELSLIELKKKNINVFKNLANCYEAEFSNLTLKLPNSEGLFKVEPERLPSKQYEGYLLYYQEKIPIGFCIVDAKNNIRDIAEFYIIPSMRKNKYGTKLAFMIFNLYPGKWQVRQIAGADQATHFWRHVIKTYTHNHYTESIVNDPVWGVVTRQQFVA